MVELLDSIFPIAEAPSSPIEFLDNTKRVILLFLSNAFAILTVPFSPTSLFARIYLYLHMLKSFIRVFFLIIFAKAIAPIFPIELDAN